MTQLRTRSFRAFTLVEMLMTIASSSIVLTALISGGVALVRSFAAVEGYSIAEGDQLRVSDYISMDVRRALTASVDNNNVLTITIPNYYDANNANPKWSNAHALAPSFDTNGAIQYRNWHNHDQVLSLGVKLYSRGQRNAQHDRDQCLVVQCDAAGSNFKRELQHYVLSNLHAYDGLRHLARWGKCAQ